MSKIFALKGHLPGPVVLGRLGIIDTRTLTEERAQELQKKGFNIIEVTPENQPPSVTKTKAATKPSTKLPDSETAVDPQSENSTAS